MKVRGSYISKQNESLFLNEIILKLGLRYTISCLKALFKPGGSTHL